MFLRLFQDTQIAELKELTDYDGFVRLIDEKNKLPLDKLDTPEEISEVNVIIDKNEELQKNVNR